MEWNRNVLQSYIKKYKENIVQIRSEEAYKWKAVRCFQDHWNLEAEDFWKMLKESLSKTENLLAANMFYPRTYILKLAEKDPEAVREMFRRLYVGDSPLEARIDEFTSTATRLKDMYFTGDRNHFQNTSAVTVYLFLRYPEEYYIYKYSECKACADKLGCSLVIPSSGKGECALAASAFYDEIREVLASDQELVEMNLDCLDTECYQERAHRMLTADIMFYISRYQEAPSVNEEAFQNWMRSQKRSNGERQYTDNTISAYIRSLNLVYTRINVSPVKSLFEIDDAKVLEQMDSRIRSDSDFVEANKALNHGALSAALKLYSDFLKWKKTDWWPSMEEYGPGLTVEDWKALLGNPAVFDENSLIVMKCFRDCGGTATCTQMSNRYGRSGNFYNRVSAELAGRIQEHTGCPMPPARDAGLRWWPILYVGRSADREEAGAYVWRLREELKAALDQTDLSAVSEFEPGKDSGNSDDMEDAENRRDGINSRKGVSRLNIGKNTILYGPPGTGKTYSTVTCAVAIIENRPLEEIEAIPYKDRLKRYRKYQQEGLVEFCTFHQSYGYEEFIEGIRPITPEDSEYTGNGGIEYKVKPGIFRKFCEDAETAAAGNSEDLGIRENPTIWKVSLQGTGENPIRTDCMENNHIRIGWSGYGRDLSAESAYADGGRSILNAFVNVMQIGDIVMSCYSESEVDAVGVITGDYEWREGGEYNRQRPVRWLTKGFKEDIVSINGGKKLTLSTVYRLNQMSLPDVLHIVRKHGKTQSVDTRNRVFIIDEINRGNISKIFGELITLIEPSKRLKSDEETRVKLPYSGVRFGIPQNVYLLGTMNTADRSIALIDTALRRRFRFVEMQPKPELLSDTTAAGIRIGELLSAVNRRIEVLYDREHTIGHAFFMELKTKGSGLNDRSDLDRLADIFEYSVIPLLQEYFYEDYEKIRLVLGDNRTDDPSLQFVIKQPDNYGGLFGAEHYFDTANAYTVNRAALHNAAAYRKIYE